MTNTISKVIHNGDEFEFDTSSVSGITTTQPSNPSEGAVYYDTTNDVVKVYDGTNWNIVGDDTADVNTKTFYLSSPSDLTNAQAGLDWYLAGKNPIFVLSDNGRVLTVYDITSTRMRIIGTIFSSTATASYTNLGLSGYSYTISNGTIVSSESTTVGNYPVLDTRHIYSTPYTPTHAGSPATKKYVDDTVASAKSSGATAPSNPTEGQLWYDTTNDVLKVYDGTNWVVVGDDTADINTKTFYLSSTSDTTTGQAALDWYLAGKNPIIVYDNVAYMVYAYFGDRLNFAAVPTYGKQYQNSCTQTYFGNIMLETSQGTVANIIINESTIQRVLSTDVNYSTPYTPTYAGSPATKKYVDDHDTVISGDSGTTYTIKVSNSAPASGTPNSTITFVI